MNEILFDLFLKILNMSVTAGMTTLIVLLIRLLIRKAPKIFSFSLWIVVLFRFLCPVSVPSSFSLFNAVPFPAAEISSVSYAPVDLVATQLTAVPALIKGDAGHVKSGSAPVDGDAGRAEPGTVPTEGDTGRAEPGTVPTEGDTGRLEPGSAPIEGDTGRLEPGSAPIEGDAGRLEPGSAPGDGSGKIYLSTPLPLVLPCLWLLGIGALLLYGLVSLALLRRKTSPATQLRDNIYLADDIASPFVCGLLRPRIYLPSFLSPREQEYIIIHEKHHIRRRDHLIKLTAFGTLCLHWFNPLAWAAFILSCKDMEMSCDEAVMRKMKQDLRAEYSASLLRLATGKQIIAGAPLAFGEGNTKNRIRNVMNYKKPSAWILLTTGAVCVLALFCLFTNPKRNGDVREFDAAAGSLFSRVCSAGEALAASKENNVVVMEDGICTYGRDVWDSFYKKVRKGKPASVLCAHYDTLEGENVSEEYYEREKDNYPKLFFSLLEYDGKSFQFTTRVCTEEQTNKTKKFAYLVHDAGSMPEQAKYSSYDYYILVDDKNITSSDINKNILSSQPGNIRWAFAFTDYSGRR